MADMKLSVDSSELDAALEKAARLSAMLDTAFALGMAVNGNG